MILAKIRAATGPLHDRIEQSLDLPKRLRSVDGYGGLLARYLGFYIPFEPLLAKTLDGLNPALAQRLGFEGRRKTGLLRGDLRVLGYSPEAIDALDVCEPDALPRVDTVGRALGSLYVLEGSTLGGQFLKKEAERTLGLTPQTGTAFFSAYPGRVRETWNGFCDIITAFAHDEPQADEEIVDASAETFLKFEQWIIGKGATVEAVAGRLLP